MKVRTSILVLLTAFTVAAQPPPPDRGPGPPPPPGGPLPPGGREIVRRRLADAKPADATGKNILALAKVYLGRSDQERSFAATRYLAAADALSQAVEHQQHLLQKGGAPPPDRAELTRHLERVYFRLQQADFFVDQSSDPKAEAIAGYARMYYQQALRAGANLRIADECAKSTEELIRALESLAQSTARPPPASAKPDREKP